MSRVLVVEDEHRLVTVTLQVDGYDVVSVGDGDAALDAASQAAPDLLVLDLGLTDMDGARVVERLRAWSTVPVLLLSTADMEERKRRALDAVADDCVTKPFVDGEFQARIRVALRRTRPESHVVTTTSFSVDLAGKRVRGTDGAEIRLTPIEWAILEILARRPGKLITKGELLEQVWGPQFVKETHYLRVYMSQLRRKLEPDPAHPRHLMTEPGRGYRLEDC